LQLESAALKLFESSGFGAVTVDQIVAAADTSPRTFYRYFPSKEDVLQVRIDARTSAVLAALRQRPRSETPVQALRAAYESALAEEDLDLLRSWMNAIAGEPSVMRGVVGGQQLKSTWLIAEFFADWLDLAADDMVPAILAAAADGVVQAVHMRWFLRAGDLRKMMSQGFDVLENELRAVPRP
jgi:AcrR family transcriptional regulator